MAAPIPGYDLDEPTADDLLRSLNQILGEPSTKSAIAVALGELDWTGRSLNQLTPKELLEVARALTRQRGLVAILGRSFAIRLISYLQLQEERS